MGKEHFPLKSLLLTNQMEQQHQIFCKHDLSTFSEEDECKHKLRLLIEITSGLDQDYLKKTTCVLERDNDLVKNKKSLE